MTHCVNTGTHAHYHNVWILTFKSLNGCIKIPNGSLDFCNNALLSGILVNVHRKILWNGAKTKRFRKGLIAWSVCNGFGVTLTRDYSWLIHKIGVRVKFLAAQRELVAEYGDVASSQSYYGPTCYQIHVVPHCCHMAVAPAAAAAAEHMLNYCMVLVSVALPALGRSVAVAWAAFDIDCKPCLWCLCYWIGVADLAWAAAGAAVAEGVVAVVVALDTEAFYRWSNLK